VRSRLRDQSGDQRQRNGEAGVYDCMIHDAHPSMGAAGAGGRVRAGRRRGSDTSG
jgi:hypothetical protein